MEYKAIIEALMCLLKGCIYEPMIVLDEKTAKTRNEYIKSTIKLLEDINNENKKNTN